jgi:hypothetical protein
VGPTVLAGTQLLDTLTVTESTITGGGVALYADGQVDFDAFAVRTPCDAGGSCTSMYDGGSCSYTYVRVYALMDTQHKPSLLARPHLPCSCAPGFYNTGTTYMCGRNGRYTMTPGCRAYSPTLPDGQQVSIKERSPLATQASPAITATVLSPSVPVTFVINSQVRGG